MELDNRLDDLESRIIDVEIELDELDENSNEAYLLTQELEDLKAERDEVEAEIAARNYEDDMSIMSASYGW